MMSVAITKAWFEDIEDKIYFEDPFFYTERNIEMVEVDVNEEEFERVSKELGWRQTKGLETTPQAKESKNCITYGERGQNYGRYYQNYYDRYYDNIIYLYRSILHISDNSRF